ncbi:hypothetical protein ACFQ0M_07715 [Kitasatospora aburaviensis]
MEHVIAPVLGAATAVVMNFVVVPLVAMLALLPDDQSVRLGVLLVRSCREVQFIPCPRGEF